MSEEWILAALLFACPFVIFGLAEAVGLIRRRRRAAIAQRTKRPRARAHQPPARRAG